MIPATLSTAPKVQSGLDAYKMYVSKDLEVVHLHLAPGEKIDLHINPVDVVFCIIEGEALLETPNEKVSLKKHDVIEIKAGIERGMKNHSRHELRLLVLKKTG
ncbi:MAG: cupin domain-containing protein [Bacteroidetes bacterium]|nr:cupin domain-containing protein [Bacteroidota bacterium]